MAKPKNTGLGRGLNSLLSSTYEESEAQEENNAPEKKAETKTAEKKKEEKQESKPTPTAADNEEIEEINEEHVTIKGVVTRQTGEVSIDKIKPNPDQPRTNFKQEDLEELAASIEKAGLLQPILVRPLKDGTYQIIAGERRWQACKSLGMQTVPIRIKEASDIEALEFAMVENIQRSDLNPIEEAYGYKRLMERQNLTQSELAQKLAKGRSTIANALRLLDLPEDAQQLLFEEKITAGHARAILAVPTAEGRQKLTARLVTDKLSVRETEAIAKMYAIKPASGETPKRMPAPKSFKKVARSLKDYLTAPVKVKTVQGKNKIEIEFKDEEDLERIYKILVEKA